MTDDPLSAIDGQCLYADLLGNAWVSLPAQIRETYFQGSPLSLSGHFTVTVGKTLVARAFQWALRLPRADGVAPVLLRVTGSRSREVWSRSIGGWKLRTVQTAGHGLLLEQVGMLEFRVRLEPWDRGMRYAQQAVRVRLFGWRIRLPRCAAPRVTAFHLVAPPPHCLAVSVILEAPGGALLVAYEGQVRREG